MLQESSCSGSRYFDVPAELQKVPQWICWRYEYRGSDKPTKVPLNPRTGAAASVTEPRAWSTFAGALAGAAAHNCNGIGFVFTANDPFCFIDLDDTKGDAEALARQHKIAEAFNSYTELSPSGTGVHIIIKAALPHGRRRGGVELYPHDRFATFTGNVINNVGIAERQELAEILFSELGGEKAATAGVQPDREASLGDEAIVEALCRDPALEALYIGDLNAYGGDHSSADQALCNALAARAGNRAQAERIWTASPLGQRDKTQGRADYRQRTIERAFDRAPLASVGTAFTVNGKPFFPPAPPPADAPVLIDAADLEAMPAAPRLDMWGGYVPVGQTTIAFGGGGSGKSLLLQQLATSTALGRPFLGIQTMAGVALYVTCEDDLAELHRRQHDICRALGVSLTNHKRRLALVSLTGVVGNELAAFDQQGRIAIMPRFQWLLDTAKAIGAKLIVLDNVAHFFAGNENIRNQVAAFLGLLNKLAHDTGAAIILIAHTNKAGDGSGSTAWLNQVRTGLKLEIPADGNGFVSDFNARVLIRVKSNYARTGESIAFRWHNGAFKLAAELPGDAAEAAKADAKAEADNATFLKCLAAATEQRRAVSHVKGTNYAPAQFAKMPEAGGLNRMAFERAMERLFHSGKIVAGQFLWNDSYRKPKHGLKLCGDPPAVTPCGDLRQPPYEAVDNTAAPLRAGTPLYINKDGAADGQPPLLASEGGAP